MIDEESGKRRVKLASAQPQGENLGKAVIWMEAVILQECMLESEGCLAHPRTLYPPEP